MISYRVHQGNAPAAHITSVPGPRPTPASLIGDAYANRACNGIVIHENSHDADSGLIRVGMIDNIGQRLVHCQHYITDLCSIDAMLSQPRPYLLA